jgi:serine/threonine-protein kinase HipA
LFAWLTGNGDLHAKNISVLQRSQEWRVAPIYDIPSTVPYGDSTMALPMGGKRAGLSRRTFAAFGADLGLPSRAVESTIEQVLSATADVGEELTHEALPLDQRRRHDLTRTLQRRRQELC